MKKSQIIMLFFCILPMFAPVFLYAQNIKSEININDVLFAPSPFITVGEDDKLSISTYLRSRDKEGNMPYMDINKTKDSAEWIVNLRVGQWGITAGWLEKISDGIQHEPEMLSADYKLPILSNIAIDFKYTTKKSEKSTLRHSFLDFGVFSITGLVNKELTWIFELYGGATANYVYINLASDEFKNLWKLIPFAGIRINVSPYHAIQVVSEINRGKINSIEDPIWTWHLGLSAGF